MRTAAALHGGQYSCAYLRVECLLVPQRGIAGQHLIDHNHLQHKSHMLTALLFTVLLSYSKGMTAATSESLTTSLDKRWGQKHLPGSCT